MVDHNVEFEPIPHPRTYTSHDSADAAHIQEDHMAKAVLVKDAKGYAIVIVPTNCWVKLEALNEDTAREFELAEESEMQDLFPDCQTGAIPPLGPAYDVETFLDKRLTSLANVYFEGGDHANLVQVSGDAFYELLKGVRQGHFSHNG
jgi:Ala-tRNA(Pro) deacylase